MRYVPPEARPDDEDMPTTPEAAQPPKQKRPTTPETPQTNTTRNPWVMVGWGAFGCMGIVLAAVFLLALVVAGTLNGGLSLLQSGVGVFLNPEPPSGSVTSSQTIVNRIQPLGQLTSTSLQVARADIEVVIQQGALGVCNHRANHVASATIEAGIDLLQVEPDSVIYNEETDTYTLFLPRPTIVDCSMDFIDQYARQVNGPTCSVDWDAARQIAQYEAMVAFRDEAVEGGLLVTAERDAASALMSFVSALTGSEVIVEFVDTGDALTNPAAACDPEPPRDWRADPLTGEWLRER